MTPLLQQAFEAAAQTTATEQNLLAQLVLDQLHSQQQWDRLFACPKSEDLLAGLAKKALDEHHSAGTKPLHISDL